jgi:AraC-like DNA-binding protein
MRLKNTIGGYDLSWLHTSPDDAGHGAGTEIDHIDFKLPPTMGTAWVEMLPLNDGIALFRAVHKLSQVHAGQLVPLIEANSSLEEPVFTAQIWLSGLGCHDEYWNGFDDLPTRIVASPGRDTFRMHQRWQSKVMVEGGTTSEMRSVTLPVRLLQTLLGEAAAGDMLDRLGLSMNRPTMVIPMPQHVSTPLREAMSAQLSGPVRKLYAQARILDYLAGLLAFVSEGKSVRRERTHQSIVHELHDFLLRAEGRVPTLTELAQKFGLSARRLNVEFIREHGQSIFNFITDHRLAQAHAMLLTDPIPLKTLAARLGYSHVNHFSAAFKKKFGYSPGSIRKKD